ncbi:MAG TPA: DUF1326 domain-containing protein [Pyrinomonadaceae bacterium]|nr:DUF1326 domain-containing protein [Pyrinomonadaceae bacterium]
MRKLFFLSLSAVVAVSCLVFSSSAENVSLHGDYVEVRTASVFAGACHYNGEVTTTGRDAMMAWSVSSGKWQGVDLAGVRAVAIVSSDANLAENDAAKQSEILIDSNVSRTQALAFLHALEEKYAAALGKVVAVRYTPVSFDHKDKSFNVVTGEATINVQAMPNDLCCKMPNMVWYKPLVGLENRKVGYTLNATYSGKSVGEPWGRSGENSAFYGTFSL